MALKKVGKGHNSYVGKYNIFSEYRAFYFFHF